MHPDPAKEHLESACQSLASGTVNEITSPHGEKSVPQCARVEVTQEERTDAACASPWMEDKMPATKPPLSRYQEKTFSRSSFLPPSQLRTCTVGSDYNIGVSVKVKSSPKGPFLETQSSIGNGKGGSFYGGVEMFWLNVHSRNQTVP